MCSLFSKFNKHFYNHFDTFIWSFAYVCFIMDFFFSPGVLSLFHLEHIPLFSLILCVGFYALDKTATSPVLKEWPRVRDKV